MQPMHLKAGARIFAAGEPSTAVYIIESGTVSISNGDPLAPTEIARLGPGELFGESGVLEKRARSATATALTETELLVTPAETFLTAFGMNNERALALVKMICKRLRDTTQRASRPRTQSAPELQAEAMVRLVPETALASTFQVAAVDVRHLPFEVGNRAGGEAIAIASNHSLTIQAHGRPELGTPHFEIVRRDGRIGIRDLGTTKGTIVNGVPMGRGSLDAFAVLQAGDNAVVAGGPDSVFRFQVHLTPGPSATRMG